MTQEEREKTVQESQRLLEAQAKEDSAKDLATIPMLGIEDLAKKNRVIPIELDKDREDHQVQIYTHSIETTGIVYARLLFDLKAVSYELLPYLSLYARALTEVGTKNYNFIDLGLEIEATTGGISAYSNIQSRVDSKESLSVFVLAGKRTLTQRFFLHCSQKVSINKVISIACKT